MCNMLKSARVIYITHIMASGDCVHGVRGVWKWCGLLGFSSFRLFTAQVVAGQKAFHGLFMLVP